MLFSRRSMTAGLAAMSGLALLGGCSSRTGALSLAAMREKAAAGELTIGFIPYYEISRYDGPDQMPSGFMPDLFGLFANAAGISANDIKWRAMAWDSFATVVDSGAIDLSIAGTFVTPERAARVAFSTPVFSLGNGAAVRSDDTRFAAVRTVMDLDRPATTIAVVSGEQSAGFVQKNFKNARILVLDGPDLAAAPRAVLTRRADVAMSDQFILGRFIQAYRGLKDVLGAQPFSVLPIAWAVAPARQSLLREIDPLLQRLAASGQIAALMRRYPMIPFAS